MKIAVLANEDQRHEWLQKGCSPAVEIEWAGSLRVLMACDADAYFDLAFAFDRARMQQYIMRGDRLLFVNSVAHTLEEIGHNFIRINAWPGFINRLIAEISLADNANEQAVARLLEAMGWQYRLLPDVPGMISARIIANIINEAYHTWGSGVSSQEDIDTAMKLGTNYPYGPFEWAHRIGLANIKDLLLRLKATDSRYQPAPALEQELAILMNRY